MRYYISSLREKKLEIEIDYDSCIYNRFNQSQLVRDRVRGDILINTWINVRSIIEFNVKELLNKKANSKKLKHIWNKL